jgi:ADP-ribosyl-[dinitrogen reductase] hydrolase
MGNRRRQGYSQDLSDRVLAAPGSAAVVSDDADTVGAVAGQIAGAHYGLSGIPNEWVQALIWRDDIINLG